MHLIIILGLWAVVGGSGVSRKQCGGGSFAAPPNRVNTSEPLGRLRAEMRKTNSVHGSPLEAYIVTSEDAHQNEFVADRDRRLEYVSGFSGSAGMAVVTLNKAALWTPDLYISQANEELSCEWLLMNDTVSIVDWLREEVPATMRIGTDPKLMANSQWESLSKSLSNIPIYLLPIKNNLVDLIWHDKPNYTHHEAMVLTPNYAGDTWHHKVSVVRAALKEEECEALVVTALDQIAWLLNIRGRDISYLPVLRSYLLLSREQIHLYTDLIKLNTQVRNHLQTDSCFTSHCVRARAYESIWEDLGTMTQKWRTVCLPSDSPSAPGVSRAIYLEVQVEKRKSIVSPIVGLKAEKNPVEREGMRKAHLRDAVAVCHFMAYLQDKINRGEKWDEMKVAKTLGEFRREQKDNEGVSFKSIVAFGAHGSLPHYEPRNITNTEVNKTSLLLIDSGGHYLDGTTDVTRTFHLGTPTREQINVYTRVLMGLINLAMLRFPETVVMREVDILARVALWDAGLEYHHGTGHGIGAFLSVHEGPIIISRDQESESTKEVFKEGYFLSDEPGYYKEDKYGIRLENILEVVRINKSESAEGFLSFTSATLVPFEPKLIDIEMLSPQQIGWLNGYNERIRNEVGAELKSQQRMAGFYWVMDRVNYIPVHPCSGVPPTLHPSALLLLLASASTAHLLFYVLF